MTVLPDESFTLATLRWAEFGFFGFIVKISRVRSVESRRSRSMTGMDSVDVDARLSVVGAVSTDRRPLYHHEVKDRHVGHGTAYLLDWLSLVRVESLAR